jgi:hypothetical protein
MFLTYSKLNLDRQIKTEFACIDKIIKKRKKLTVQRVQIEERIEIGMIEADQALIAMMLLLLLKLMVMMLIVTFKRRVEIDFITNVLNGGSGETGGYGRALIATTTIRIVVIRIVFARGGRRRRVAEIAEPETGEVGIECLIVAHWIVQVTAVCGGG